MSNNDLMNTIQNKITKLPTSDSVLLTNFWTLPHRSPEVNPYSRIINRFYSSVVTKLESDASLKYQDVKLDLLRDVLEQLWVVKAGKGETFKVFKNFESFEEILFRSNPEYRGHYVHQFDVFLLGYLILNKIISTNTPIAKKFRTSDNPNFTWMLTSTFHDMGYPIEKMDKWFSNFVNTFMKIESDYQIEIEKILTPIFFDYLGYLSEEHYNRNRSQIAVSGQCYLRDWNFHNILLTNLRKKDHGVISSLLLIHSLLTQEKIKNFETWFHVTFPREIIPACYAIAVHNLRRKDTKIHLSNNPYAFLLVLCDTIQDWERSILTKDHSEIHSIDIDLSEENIIIDFSLKINNDRKIDELTDLSKKLDTSGLLTIRIRQENSNNIWEL